MTDTVEIDTNKVAAPRRARQTRDTRPDIILPGEILRPRARFARENVYTCEKSVARMNLPTSYIGGIAHIAVNAAMKIYAERIKRRNEPVKHRRTRG